MSKHISTDLLAKIIVLAGGKTTFCIVAIA